MTEAAESSQPRKRPGVERFGIEPIPAELRTVGWHDLFAILFTFNLSPLVYVLGALAVTVGGLPLWWAAGSMGVGALLGTSLLAVAGRAGVDDGLPGQVAMRATFGEWGARGLTSMYRFVSSAYWFGGQALAAAFGLTVIFDALTGHKFGLAPVALVLGAVSVVLASVGFDALRYFVRVVGPLIIALVTIFVVLFLTTGDPAFGVSRVFEPTELSFAWVSVAAFFTIAAGGQLSFATNIADFCRYARSRNHMRIGIIVGSTTGFFVASWIGAYAATAIDSTNPFAAISDLTSNRPILIFMFVAIAAQIISVNVLNLYTAGLSLVNTAPRLGRLTSTMIAGAVSLTVAGFPSFINDANEWFTHIGSLGAATAGAIMADYALIARYKIDVPALFDPKGRYRFIGGLNPAALAAVAIGTGAYYAVPDDWLKVAWGFVVGLLAYLGLAVAQSAAFPSLGPPIAALRRAIQPGRVRPAPQGPAWAASALAAEIGQSLRETRVEQGLDVDELEAALGISATYLSALENGTFDRMPSHTHARGFLGAYAEHLGLDTPEILYEFDSISTPRQARRPRRGGRRLAVTGAVLLLAGAAAGVGVWQLLSDSEASTRASAPLASVGSDGTGTPMPVEAPLRTEASDPEAAPSETRASVGAQKGTTPRLVITAVRGDSWLSVRVGSASGGTLYQGVLKKGRTVIFKRKRLWIRMGAPQRLDATLDGEALSSLPTRTAAVVVTAAGMRTVSRG